MKDIIKITLLDNFTITNKDGALYHNQKCIFVYYRDDTRRILDLVSNTDITYRVDTKELILNINDDVLKNEQIIYKEDKWEDE